MKKTISIDTPIAEITLRKYEKPDKLSKRELVRKFCLSVGLLQPGDSRDVVVDVLQVLLEAKKPLSSEAVKDLVMKSRKKHALPMQGIASSNVRRQILRLRDLFLVDKLKNSYMIKEKLSISEIYSEHIEKYFLPSILSRVSDYSKQVDVVFGRK
ncbi:MAG: hypothetical protein V1659_01775 [Candidatus Woesearchaeota archaeon]